MVTQTPDPPWAEGALSLHAQKLGSLTLACATLHGGRGPAVAPGGAEGLLSV